MIRTDASSLPGLLPGLCTLAFGLMLAGCEQTEDPPEPADDDGVTVETFEPSVDDAIGPFGDRLPSSESQTILVPATDLFPGTVIVDPDIPNPYAGDQEAIAAGERHFDAFNCSGCHAPLGGGGMGPPLSDDDWIYGSQPAQVYLSIMHGRPEGMPAWSAMIPEKTAWELVAYIETLDEIEDYAAEKDFDENVDGFRGTDSEE